MLEKSEMLTWVYDFVLQGYNGSQLWDVSLAVQAILATNLAGEFAPMLKKAHSFIKNSQVPCTDRSRILLSTCIYITKQIAIAAYPVILDFFNLKIHFGVKVRANSSDDLNDWYRHISKGAWPFSTPDNGWPVSDCTAEGLKASHILS